MTTLYPESLFPTGSPELFENFFGDEFELNEMFEENRRRYQVLLMQEGTPVKLLVKKTSGQRCPYWNNESQQCSRPLEHPKCFNTGWTGGYEKPLDILVRFVSPGTNISWYNNGIRVNRELRCWSLWKPLLKSWDVIVKAQTNERFFLQEVTVVPPWRNDKILFQEFDVKLITSEPVRFFSKEDGLVLL